MSKERKKMVHIYTRKGSAHQQRSFVTRSDEGNTLTVYEVEQFDDELTVLNCLGVVSSIFYARQLIKAVCAPTCPGPDKIRDDAQENYKLASLQADCLALVRGYWQHFLSHAPRPLDFASYQEWRNHATRMGYQDYLNERLAFFKSFAKTGLEESQEE